MFGFGYEVDFNAVKSNAKVASMLDIDRVLQNRELMKALTGLNRHNFFDLLPKFSNAYEELYESVEANHLSADSCRLTAKKLRDELFFILFYCKFHPTFRLSKSLFKYNDTQLSQYTSDLKRALEHVLAQRITLPSHQISSIDELLDHVPFAEKAIVSNTAEVAYQTQEVVKRNKVHTAFTETDSSQLSIVDTESKKRKNFPILNLSVLAVLVSLGVVFFGKGYFDSLSGNYSASPVTTSKKHDSVESNATQVTVKIVAIEEEESDSVSTEGSGTLIGCENNVCKVITNSHVVNGNTRLNILTYDQKNHDGRVKIEYVTADLALVEFYSRDSYVSVPFNKLPGIEAEEEVFAAGFPFGSSEILVDSGNLNLVLEQPLKDGYKIGYSVDVKQGMSGGPLLNSRGELVGINGKSSHPLRIFNNAPYLYENGEEVKEYSSKTLDEYSWAIPLEAFLELID